MPQAEAFREKEREGPRGDSREDLNGRCPGAPPSLQVMLEPPSPPQGASRILMSFRFPVAGILGTWNVEPGTWNP